MLIAEENMEAATKTGKALKPFLGGTTVLWSTPCG
jgi:hypothetical protein